MKKLVLGVIIFIVVGIIVLLYFSNTSNGIPKSIIEEMGFDLFGDDYCTTNHYLEIGGSALTKCQCSLCKKVSINPSTNIPALCENCAKITKRCSECGKLEK